MFFSKSVISDGSSSLGGVWLSMLRREQGRYRAALQLRTLAQNGAGQELFISVVTSNWIEKLCGSVVE